ncbi:hypothetical protein C8F01DRAFT_1368752 [Mycena amicta]|nr:hypothetical protein C8F01DRAFT_1368752 [Mycena amicta]
MSMLVLSDFVPVQPRNLRPLDYDVLLHRQRIRNEKARQHMARKRAELKLRPLHEQQQVAERTRIYRARYCQRHREAMLRGEAQRWGKIYLERYGEVAYQEYLERREQRAHDHEDPTASDGLPSTDCNVPTML